MTRAEITTPDQLSEESAVELSLRPQRLAEFIGQDKVKDNLRIAIDAALARKEPLDHTLFYGPPGLGKTTLAELIARELSVNIHTTSGPAVEKPGDLVSRLTNMRSATSSSSTRSTGCARWWRSSSTRRWRTTGSTSG
jgi:Holliday junction DNA helicase RuvB